MMEEQPKPGLAVDSSGGPVVDPTANVIALNEASVKRLDDLRSEADRRFTAELKAIQVEVDAVRDIAKLRAEHAAEISALRSDHSEKMALAESKRLDSVRQLDVQSQATAAVEAKAAIATLAQTAQTTAETLRTRVDSTAQAIAKSSADAMEAFNKRIALLEQSSYTGAGRQAVADPAIAQAMARIEELAANMDRGTGKSAGATAMWGYIVAGIGLLVTLLGAAGVAIALILRFAK